MQFIINQEIYTLTKKTYPKILKICQYSKFKGIFLIKMFAQSRKFNKLMNLSKINRPKYQTYIIQEKIIIEYKIFLEYQKNRKHPFRVGDRRDAYDDEDDDEDNRFDDEDDDDDDHFEPDSFDGASDDVLHRRSSENELNALQKERSKSLQSLEDLSDVKNRSPHKNKQSINPFHQKMKGHYNAPQNYDQMKQMFFNRLSEQKKIEEHRTEVRELENKESDKAIHFVGNYKINFIIV